MPYCSIVLTSFPVTILVANSITSLSVSSFPTIYFSPAGKTNQPKRYEVRPTTLQSFNEPCTWPVTFIHPLSLVPGSSRGEGLPQLPEEGSLARPRRERSKGGAVNEQEREVRTGRGALWEMWFGTSPRHSRRRLSVESRRNI